MADHKDPRTKLLAEVLHDDWTHGTAAHFPREAAAYARRRRSLRRGALALAGIATLFAITLVSVRREIPPARNLPIPKTERAYEIISDEEFMRVLRDRPLLILPDSKGALQFVVLDSK
jgi:hypothetical protein